MKRKKETQLCRYCYNNIFPHIISLELTTKNDLAVVQKQMPNSQKITTT